jgi:hypothetical protein
MPACDEGQLCDDLDPCTGDDVCTRGLCRGEPLSGTPCEDGDVCNGAEECLEGVCQSGNPLDCDDNDPCTQNLCDSSAGCVFPPISGCISCTEDVDCQVECHAGSCVQNTCQLTPIEGPCDDGNACTGGDQCQNGICKPGALLDCHDDDPCTEDDCDASQGCVYTPLTGLPPEEGPGSTLCTDGLDNDCDGWTDGEDEGCLQVMTPEGLCTSGQSRWCWENPLPHGNDLVGVWGEGSRAHAVGPNGLLVTLSGSQPQVEPLSTFEDLRAVHGDGATLAIVAEGLLMLKVEGQGSHDFLRPGRDFRDVWVETASRIWLANSSGSLEWYDGSSVQPFTPPPPLTSPQAVAVLDSRPWCGDALGNRARFDGADWQPEWAIPGTPGVSDLAVRRSGQGEGEMWSTSLDGRLDRFDDQAGAWWTEVSVGEPLHALAFGQGGSGVAVGDGIVLGTTQQGDWRPLPAPPGNYRGAAALGAAGANTFSFLAAGLRGAWLYRDSGVIKATQRFTDKTLRAVWCGENDRAWAVGDGGAVFSRRPNPDSGLVWAAEASAPVRLHGVWSDGQQKTWVVGEGGTIGRIDFGADTIQSEASPVNTTLRAVVGVPSMAGGFDLWAVGDGGRVLRQEQNSDWSLVGTGQPLVTEDLRALAPTTEGIWAVGANGTVLRCVNTGGCNPVLGPTTTTGEKPDLQAVVALGPGRLLAADDQGHLFWGESLAWMPLAQFGGRAFRALAARQLPTMDSEVFGVGDQGLAVRLVVGVMGEPTPVQVQLGANVDLLGLCADPGGSNSGLRAVGAGGAILRHGP